MTALIEIQAQFEKNCVTQERRVLRDQAWVNTRNLHRCTGVGIRYLDSQSILLLKLPVMFSFAYLRQIGTLIAVLSQSFQAWNIKLTSLKWQPKRGIYKIGSTLSSGWTASCETIWNHMKSYESEHGMFLPAEFTGNQGETCLMSAVLRNHVEVPGKETWDRQQQSYHVISIAKLLGGSNMFSKYHTISIYVHPTCDNDAMWCL